MMWKRQMWVVVVLVAMVATVAGESKYSTEIQPALGTLTYFHDRLLELAKRLATRPSAQALSSYGISKNHDAMERTMRLGFLAPSIGHAANVEMAPTLFFETDPALTLAVVSTLDSEIGRPPSHDEIEQELAAFDARIAEVNARLAKQRDQRAAAYRKTGRIPEEIERVALEPFYRDDVVPHATDDSRVQSDAERQLGHRIDLITQYLNQAISKP